MKNVYAIRDNKLASFGMLVVLENDAVASRQFGDIVTSDKGGIMSMHPSDFTLYRLGSYDDKTGKVENLDCPLAIATGSDFFINKKDEE